MAKIEEIKEIEKIPINEDDLIIKVKLDSNDEIKIPVNKNIMPPKDSEIPGFKFDLDWM